MRTDLGNFLSRREMKEIKGGQQDPVKCVQGNQYFYDGPDGCGTTTVVGGDDQGNCSIQIKITEYQPCGWA
jgi:hypothetical protein